MEASLRGSNGTTGNTRIGGVIECENCGWRSFEIPDDTSGDPLIKCRCRVTLGPIFSLRAFSNDQAHTTVKAKLVKD